MKKVIITILLAASIFLLITLFTGCAKKTYQLDSAHVAKQAKTSSDSTGHKKTVVDDHSVTTTTRSIDTAVSFTGKPLTGTILPGIADTHFENDDVRLDLHTDQATGKTTGTATPKKKILPVKLNETTRTANNIQTSTDEQTRLKTKADIKSDSTARHEVKHVDPSAAVHSLRSIVIWFLVIVAIAGLVFYFGRKFI